MKRRIVLAGIAAIPAWLSGCGGGSGSGQSGASAPNNPPSVETPEQVYVPPESPETPQRVHHFKPLEGDVFYIAHPIYGSIDATLKPVASVNVDTQLEQFSLTFDIPSGSALSDGIHSVIHHRTGTQFDMYLQLQDSDSVIGKEKYTAAFSHLTELR